MKRTIIFAAAVAVALLGMGCVNKAEDSDASAKKQGVTFAPMDEVAKQKQAQASQKSGD